MPAVLDPITNQLAPGAFNNPPTNGGPRSTAPVAQRPAIRRITVKEYDSMIEHGILTKYDQVELLDGLLINTMPKGKKHAALNDIIAAHLVSLLATRACVRNQNPVALDDFSEPEPDIVVAEAPLNRYFDHHPGPAEIFLALEIADSTLQYDRDDKGLAYARAGLRQYLVCNVKGRAIEDYRDPDADGYRSKQTYADGQSFPLAAFPDITINVSDLLPPETA